MKTRMLFFLIPLCVISCKKEGVENTNFTNNPAFDGSIFGVYNYFEKKNDNPIEDACNSYLKKITSIDNTHISFDERIMTFVKKDSNKILFSLNSGNTTISLTHFPCSDSIYYNAPNSFGPPTIGYGKKINGNNCPTSTPLEFESLHCDQGPDNIYCFSSSNTKTNSSRIIDEVHVSIYSLSQTASIGIENRFYVKVPVDSTLTLLPGDYWIGQIPLGDKPILDLTIPLNDGDLEIDKFKAGHIRIINSGGLYTISFDFTCVEGSLWTGYYHGEIF